MIIDLLETPTVFRPPTRATDGAAGFDLYADSSTPDVVKIPPLGRVVFNTGVMVAIPHGNAGFIWPRSGLAVKRQKSRAADRQSRGLTG